jgi:large subunit ribosomal protein L22
MEKVAQAKLRNLRQSPRKVRLVTSLIEGKSVDKAILELSSLAKRASDPLKKLVKSAVANAKGLNLDPNRLFVKNVSVDGGTILYRRRPRARGRAFPIRKRTSHVSLVLGERAKDKTISKEPKTEAKSQT